MTRKVMLICISAILFAGLAVPLTAQMDYKMLNITEEGRYWRDRLDVSNWEAGEDFVYLDAYYYPWTGTDSMDYEIAMGKLKVNGSTVGVDMLQNELPANSEGKDLVTVQATPEQIDEIKDMPNVVAVSLVGIKSDADLKKLEEMKNLRALDISYAKISDVGCSHLTSLSELRVVNLSSTEITDAGLKHLSKLENLRAINLEGTEITDEGVAYLKDLNNLRSLNLYRTRVGGGAESLALRGRPLKVSDDGLSALAGMSKLSELNLHGAAITDKGIANITAMTDLSKLDISATSVSDECIDDLSKLSNLHHLDLKGTDITPEGLARLRKALPDCEIDY